MTAKKPMVTKKAVRKKKGRFLKNGSLSESAIQTLILDWLKDVGVLHWRQNSGNVFAGNRRVKLGESGLPDIVVVIGPLGRMVGLEVKSAKGSLRPAQVEFAADLVKNGGSYYVVRSLADAMDAIAGEVGLKFAGVNVG